MKKRVFVAVEISDEARQKVAAYIKFLREGFPQVRVGWDKTEKLHLTLKFLGEINDEQLAKLIKATEQTAHEISIFKLQIAKPGVFPSPKQARILWLGVNGDTERLRKLNEILELKCEDVGFPKEKRNFKAHLTIARLKEKSRELVEAHLQQKFEPVEFEVSEIVVFQSELQPTGSIYSVISKKKLSTDKIVKNE